MKRFALIAWVVACGSNRDGQLPDAPAGGDAGGSGTPEPCAISVQSSEITGDTGSGSGSCSAPLINDSTFAIDFVAVQDGSDNASSEISCTITPGVVPQTLGVRSGTTGCTVEIDYNKAGNGILDSWDADAESTVDIVLTDLAPVSGTIHLALTSDNSVAMTVDGTF